MTNKTQIDALDARILLALDEDHEATTLSLARTLGSARNTVHARLKKMRERRVLGRSSRRVVPSSLGYDMTAFVEVSITQGRADVAYVAISTIPEVIEAHATTGVSDLLIKVVARDTADLHRVTNEVLSAPGVERTSTSLSLEEVIPYQLASLLRQAATQ